jgi:GNAT superfamily N-acetyltransferase
VTIRAARSGDAASLSSLLRGLEMFARLREEPAETTADRVGRHLDMCLRDESHSVLVAERVEGDLVGYVSVHWLPYLFFSGPEGFVSELFIEACHRGRGLGSRLLDAVVVEARGRGCRRLSLAAVKDRESYLRRFYPERGWRERADMALMMYDL